MSDPLYTAADLGSSNVLLAFGPHLSVLRDLGLANEFQNAAYAVAHARLRKNPRVPVVFEVRRGWVSPELQDALNRVGITQRFPANLALRLEISA